MNSLDMYLLGLKVVRPALGAIGVVLCWQYSSKAVNAEGLGNKVMAGAIAAMLVPFTIGYILSGMGY